MDKLNARDRYAWHAGRGEGGNKQQLDMAQFCKLSALEAEDFAMLGGLMDKLM